jgi:DNA-binding NarL/FixJ family response regulator
MLSRTDSPTIDLMFPATRAQGRVARLLLEGNSTRQISRAVGIVPGTVKHHVAALLRANGLQSRFQFIARHAHVLQCSLEERNAAPLSSREKVVAAHVAAGLSDKEIAAVTGRSISTIKHQLRSMRRKLRVHQRALIIRRLHCSGLAAA